MNFRNLILALGLISLSAFAQEVEDFESAQIGQFRDLGLLHAANITPGAEIVNLNDGTYNKVLKLNVSKSKLFTAFYRFKTAYSGKIVIDFDFKTNSYLPQTRIAVAQKDSSLKSLPYKSVVWLSLGYKNKLHYYSQGWKALDVFSLNKWHHLKMIVYVSGNKAGTFDVNIDGGEFEGLGLKWRNQLKPDAGNPLGMLFFQINQNAGFKGDEHLMIDNLRVKLLDADKTDGKVKEKAAVNEKDRLYEGTFYSKVLKQKKNFTAILPEDYKKSSDNYPVLYLFHGRGRNERSLFDNPEAKAALMKAGFITVFPDGDDGWYINSPVKKQDRYNDYIEEFMKYVESKLRISKDPSKRGLSGWSMGGYGCTMFAEAHSNDFSALAPIIALLDYPRTGLPEGQSYKKEPGRFGNDQTVWEKFNPINNVAKLKGKNILIITGDKCFTLTMNKNFVKKLSELNIPYKFKILKGGHSLSVVIKSIPYIVDFMNEKLK